jgi:hypothetical protein
MVLQRLAAFSGAASHRRSMLHLSSEFLSNDIVLWGSLELCHCFLTARRVTAIMNLIV